MMVVMVMGAGHLMGLLVELVYAGVAGVVHRALLHVFPSN